MQLVNADAVDFSLSEGCAWSFKIGHHQFGTLWAEVGGTYNDKASVRIVLAPPNNVFHPGRKIVAHLWDIDKKIKEEDYTFDSYSDAEEALHKYAIEHNLEGTCHDTKINRKVV